VWYEAAAFVNWLNTSTGHTAAYNLNSEATSLSQWTSEQAWQIGGENLYRHKDAYYFLPSEDEWYKAAFHKNDGATANYWDYATGSNTSPVAVVGGTTGGTAVFGGVAAAPADITQAGGLSSYGTMGQGGNVWEWQEGALDSVNDVGSEIRAIRGGDWGDGESFLRSSDRGAFTPTQDQNDNGFRVASVPEPTPVMALCSAGVFALCVRRRRIYRQLS
jgi:formylglycine-generating enzyme required for sulfatase activity